MSQPSLKKFAVNQIGNKFDVVAAQLHSRTTNSQKGLEMRSHLKRYLDLKVYPISELYLNTEKVSTHLLEMRLP